MRKQKVHEDQLTLLDLPERKPVSQQKFKRVTRPIWTENKAKLIERYLYYFVQVTHHGTYIDGFAGPQTEEDSDMWTAKLILNSEPRWFRNFFLVDVNPQQAGFLRNLRNSQPKVGKRRVVVYEGDCNLIIPQLLKRNKVPEEASFCLLDQRSIECSWSTVQAVANYKSGNKIEIFYFLMSAWHNRTLSAVGDKSALDAWFGNSDWVKLASLKPWDRANLMCERFKMELGYKFAIPWPIYGYLNGHKRIMYFMIHATDHPAAPALMARAYEKAVEPKETLKQLDLWLKTSGFSGTAEA